MKYSIPIFCVTTCCDAIVEDAPDCGLVTCPACGRAADVEISDGCGETETSRSLDSKKWELVYSGRVCNVYQLRDPQKGPIYQTADRGEASPGWKYMGNCLDAARDASNFGVLLDPTS